MLQSSNENRLECYVNLTFLKDVFIFIVCAWVFCLYGEVWVTFAFSVWGGQKEAWDQARQSALERQTNLCRFKANLVRTQSYIEMTYVKERKKKRTLYSLEIPGVTGRFELSCKAMNWAPGLWKCSQLLSPLFSTDQFSVLKIWKKDKSGSNCFPIVESHSISFKLTNALTRKRQGKHKFPKCELLASWFDRPWLPIDENK